MCSYPPCNTTYSARVRPAGTVKETAQSGFLYLQGDGQPGPCTVKDSLVRRSVAISAPSQSRFRVARLRMTKSLPMPCAPNTSPASLDTTSLDGQPLARFHFRASGGWRRHRLIGAPVAVTVCHAPDRAGPLPVRVRVFPALKAGGFCP